MGKKIQRFTGLIRAKEIFYAENLAKNGEQGADSPGQSPARPRREVEDENVPLTGEPGMSVRGREKGKGRARAGSCWAVAATWAKRERRGALAP